MSISIFATGSIGAVTSSNTASGAGSGSGSGQVSVFTTLNQVSSQGNAVEDSIVTSVEKAVSYDVLLKLKEDYIDKLTGNSDMTTFSSTQVLFVILNEINSSDNINTDYDLLLVEVISGLITLIDKSQAQYIDILILNNRIDLLKTTIELKNEEIGNLKFELSKYLEENSTNPQLLAGTMTMETATLPSMLYLLMHIDIVRAWYYFLYGLPDMEILDPNKVIYIFSYLRTFNNLEEAKTEFRKRLDEKFN